MNYVVDNLDIVYKQNDKYRQMEWKDKKRLLLLAATGLLKEAQDELRGVSGGSLPERIVSGLLRANAVPVFAFQSVYR